MGARLGTPFGRRRRRRRCVEIVAALPGKEGAVATTGLQRLTIGGYCDRIESGWEGVPRWCAAHRSLEHARTQGVVPFGELAACAPRALLPGFYLSLATGEVGGQGRERWFVGSTDTKTFLSPLCMFLHSRVCVCTTCAVAPSAVPMPLSEYLCWAPGTRRARQWVAQGWLCACVGKALAR